MGRQTVTISFCSGISNIEIDIISGLSYDNIIQKCIHHIRDKVCDHQSDAYKSVAMYVPAFGLRLLRTDRSRGNPVWLPYWHKFLTPQLESQAEEKYEFRIRYRPLGIYNPDSIMGEYLFLQMKDDFLRDPDFPLKDMSENVFLLLLGIALLLEKKELPLQNKKIVDSNWDIPSLRWQNYLTFPKELSASKALCDRLTGEKFYYIEQKYWSFVGIRKNLKKMKERQACLRFFKEKFHEYLIKADSRYCLEFYQINPVDQIEPVSAMMKFNCNSSESGLYYGQNQECLLSDIEEVKLVNPTNLRDEKWTVRIYLKEGSKDLPFKTKSEAESFLSMAQTQVKLYVRWDCFLSYHVLGRRELMDLQLKSFGPLYDTTAEKHLKDLIVNHAFKDRGFLIHQSISEFQVYVVVSCVQSQNQTSGVSDVEGIERHCIVVGEQGDMTLRKINADPSDGQQFWNLDELYCSLLTQFGLQAQPCDYPKKADINDEFRRDNDLDGEVAEPPPVLARPVKPDGEEMPSVFLSQDLKNQTEILDKNIKIKKFKVHYNNKALMMVRVATTDQDDAKAFLEGLERLEELRRFKPQRFLELHKYVLGSRLAFVTELPQHGDLLTYICSEPQSPQDKVELMRQVVVALLAMHECKHFHGNIRSRKFLVFDEPSRQSVRLKLEFPGMTSQFDTKPLDDEFNVERLAWLSQERRKNLEDITYASECYSVGTTLAEIVYRTDNFDTVDLKNNEEIPPPKDAGSEGADEVDTLWHSLWDLIIKPCWNKEPSLRPVPNKILADFISINQKAGEIAKDRKEEAKEPYYGSLGICEVDSAPSHEQLRELLQQKYKDHISDKELRLERQPMGKGHFGVVWKGEMMEPVQDIPIPFGSTLIPQQRRTMPVAVKMMNYFKGYNEDSFRQEIYIAGKLKHNNVLELLQTGYIPRPGDPTHSQLVLITEYMDGGSLQDYLSKNCKHENPETMERLTSICSDVIKGMVYLSGKHIVHRDLAPRNVLLKSIGNGKILAKVSDFGLSRIMDENYKFYRSKTNQEFPWPAWPPECLGEDLSERLFTTEGDVWSFGILLWLVFTPKGELVSTMRKQTPNANMTQAREMYRRGWRPPKHRLMSDSLYGVMKHCWAQDPKDRPVFVDLEAKFDNFHSKQN